MCVLGYFSLKFSASWHFSFTHSLSLSLTHIVKSSLITYLFNIHLSDSRLSSLFVFASSGMCVCACVLDIYIDIFILDFRGMVKCIRSSDGICAKQIDRNIIIVKTPQIDRNIIIVKTPTAE